MRVFLLPFLLLFLQRRALLQCCVYVIRRSSEEYPNMSCLLKRVSYSGQILRLIIKVNALFRLRMTLKDFFFSKIMKIGGSMGSHAKFANSIPTDARVGDIQREWQSDPSYGGMLFNCLLDISRVLHPSRISRSTIDPSCP